MKTVTSCDKGGRRERAWEWGGCIETTKEEVQATNGNLITHLSEKSHAGRIAAVARRFKNERACDNMIRRY